jgi:SNF2 family DNA or RNA helicase
MESSSRNSVPVYFSAANPIEARERVHKGTFTQIDENSPRDLSPDFTSVQLKSHQLAAVHEMKRLECMSGDITTKLGVYCDKVGAGKTYAMLAHVVARPMLETTTFIPNSFGGLVSLYNRTDTYDPVNTNIIVVPHTIVSQWKESLQKFQVKSHVIYRKAHVLECIERYNEFSVIVVSSTFYKYVYMQCLGYRVQRVIFDEADTITIPRCDRIMAGFYWFMTSSVSNLVYPNGMHVHNHHRVEGVRGNDFVKNTFQNILGFPFLDKLFVKNKDDFVDMSFQLPEPSTRSILCKTPAYMGVIGTFASRTVVESLNAGDITTAMQHLRDSGINVQSGDNLLQAIADSYKSKIRNLELTIEYVNTLENVPERERTRRLQGLQTEIESARTRSENIQEKIHNLSKENCPVCYEVLEDPTCLLSCCNNVFCYECMKNITSSDRTNRCPFCRLDISLGNLQIIHNHGIPESTEPTVYSKLETLRGLLKDNPHGKFLVFSSFDNTFERIKDSFREENFRIGRPIGSSTAIQKKIREFSEGTLNVLLLNSQHLGSGLNLESATHVIFFHSMPKATQQQVIGRAQRAGRTCSLEIVYLLHTNEEVISEECENRRGTL